VAGSIARVAHVATPGTRDPTVHKQRPHDLQWSQDADETGTGEASPRKVKSPWHLKTMIIVGSVLMVVSGLGLGLLFGVSGRYEDEVTRDDILEGMPQPESAADGPFNYLVLGTDSREDESTEQADSTGSQSDTIVLVHVAKGLQRAFIVSIPRDSYVDVPAGGKWAGGKNKINAAFAYGGARLAAKTIYNLTKVSLNGAMIVNFAGVRNMIEAVDGVRVCIPYRVVSSFGEYQKTWDIGCHDMDGREAEVFVRQRKGVPGGDFGRMKSQQLVMQALAKKAASSGTITNPAKLDALLLTAARSLTVDNNLNLRDLAFSLKGIDPGSIMFASAPHAGTMRTEAGSSVQLDEAGCAELFQAIRDDKTAEWLAKHPQSEVASY
jgi:LCP family protein required for cell wall assembly